MATRSSVHSTILFGNKYSPSSSLFPPFSWGHRLRLDWASASVERRVGPGVGRKVKEEEEVERGGRVGREVEVEEAEEDRRKSGLVVLLGQRTPRMR